MTVGDTHAHLCLDGQEPAVSLHFENLDGHPNHSDDEATHNDYEYEIDTQILLAKSGLDLTNEHDDFNYIALLYSTPRVFLALNKYSHSSYLIFNNLQDLTLLLPPSRAPPVIG